MRYIYANSFLDGFKMTKAMRRYHELHCNRYHIRSVKVIANIHDRFSFSSLAKVIIKR